MNEVNELGYTHSTAVLIRNNMYYTVVVTDQKGESTEYQDDMFIRAYLSDEPCFYDWLGGVECPYSAYRYGEIISTKSY